MATHIHHESKLRIHTADPDRVVRTPPVYVMYRANAPDYAEPQQQGCYVVSQPATAS